MTHVAFVCVSAWLWRREALRHYKLQFWSQRRRKAARLQGPAETQPDRDVKTFSTRRRFIALYSFWLVSQAEPSQWWPFECPELGSSQTVFFFFKVKFQSDGAASITDSAGGDGCLPVTGLPLWKPWVFPSRLTASYCTYMLKPLRRSFLFFSPLTRTIISLFVVWALVWCLYIVGENPKSCKWKQKSCQILKGRKNSSSDFVLFLAFECILDPCLFLFTVAYLYIRVDVDFSQATTI